MEKRLRHIDDLEADYFSFYELLCSYLDKDGVLRDVIIDGCVISNVPKNLSIVQWEGEKKFLGFTFYSGTFRFCGFRCHNVHILNNNVFLGQK